MRAQDACSRSPCGDGQLAGAYHIVQRTADHAVEVEARDHVSGAGGLAIDLEVWARGEHRPQRVLSRPQPIARFAR